MGFVADSERFVQLAFAAGAAIVLLAYCGLIVIFFMRSLRARHARRQQRVFNTWRPLFAASLTETPERIPLLRKRDVLDVLLLWNHLQDSLRGDGKERLSEIAYRAGLDRTARQLLHKGGLSERLVAIRALGNLREASVWAKLDRHSRSAQPALSLAAARAMIQIDVHRALSSLVPLITTRDDWAPASVALLLRDSADKAAVCQALARAAVQAPVDAVPRLVDYLSAVRCERTAPVLRQLLRGSPPVKVLLACLPVLSEPHDLEFIYGCLRHADWRVRMRAASAIGRLGVPGDEERLLPLLSDPHWWVRYRAAQALAALPFMEASGLRALRQDCRDVFARDIMAQVIAESPSV